HDLARVLEAQQLPHQWAAAIVDGHGLVVARVPEPQRFVGQPATAAYVALTARGDSGAARMPGLDGVRRHTVFNRLENAGWTVYLAIPTVTMDAGFRRSLVTLIGGGLVFLAAGIALAVVVGRRLTAPIVALSTAAVRLGAGQLPDTPPGSRVAEVAAPAEDDAARELARRFPPDRRGNHPVARALRSGRPELTGEISAETLETIAPDPAHRELAQAMAYASYLVVPLIARERTLGALS